MLKIDVIRFEAQDVITTSVARPSSGKNCGCSSDCYYDTNGGIHHTGNRDCNCPKFDYEYHENASRTPPTP